LRVFWKIAYVGYMGSKAEVSLKHPPTSIQRPLCTLKADIEIWV